MSREYELLHADGDIGDAFRCARLAAIASRRDKAVSNPFPRGTEEWQAWNLGWNTAPEPKEMT